MSFDGFQVLIRAIQTFFERRFGFTIEFDPEEGFPVPPSARAIDELVDEIERLLGKPVSEATQGELVQALDAVETQNGELIRRIRMSVSGGREVHTTHFAAQLAAGGSQTLQQEAEDGDRLIIGWAINFEAQHANANQEARCSFHLSANDPVTRAGSGNQEIDDDDDYLQRFTFSLNDETVGWSHGDERTVMLPDGMGVPWNEGVTLTFTATEQISNNGIDVDLTVFWIFV